MDMIIIEDLEVFYRVGVSEAERVKPQRLLLHVEMERDFKRAAAQDDLRETIDYYSVCQRLLGLGVGRQWQLIETIAVEMAELILKEYAAHSVTVEVKKFIVPQTRHVAVRVRRP